MRQRKNDKAAEAAARKINRDASLSSRRRAVRCTGIVTGTLIAVFLCSAAILFFTPPAAPVAADSSNTKAAAEAAAAATAALQAKAKSFKAPEESEIQKVASSLWNWGQADRNSVSEKPAATAEAGIPTESGAAPAASGGLAAGKADATKSAEAQPARKHNVWSGAQAFIRNTMQKLRKRKPAPE